MKAKDVIIAFCKKKRDLIKKATGYSDYVTEKDLTEIQKWPVIECERIATYLTNRITKNLVGNDKHICPWCILKGISWVNCRDCEYSERHGDCGDSTSTYAAILQQALLMNVVDNAGQDTDWGAASIIAISGVLKGLEKFIQENPVEK